MTVQQLVHKIPQPPATGYCELVRQLRFPADGSPPKGNPWDAVNKRDPTAGGIVVKPFSRESLSWFVSWSRESNLKGRDLRANLRAGHTIPMARPLWPFSFLHAEM